MHKFGTDGIRSKATDFTPDLLAKIIRGLIDYAGDNIKIFLAGDTRESTEWILADLESACETFGLEYANAGILPTPAIIHCFYESGFDFAIDVTASHNPVSDNGIKIIERGKKCGVKLSQKGREFIEAALASDTTCTLIPPSLRENIHRESLDLYLDHLKSYIGKADFTGLHIGIDCANGATSVVGPQIFESLGAEVTLINCAPTYNTEINKDCGSTHLEQLQSLVTDNHLDFGFAFDGDGDRCLAVDAQGDAVDGDQMLAFLSQFLGLDSIVTTVMAGQGLLNWAKESGVHAEITDVGDPNVVAAMQEHGIKIGSEQNGHVILPGLTSGDGMLTALMITKAVTSTQQSLQNLASIITKFPQTIVNFPATPEQKKALKTSAEAKQLLLDYSKKLESLDGRLLVRPSGTEPLIRITMWGNDEPTTITLAGELKTKLEELL